MKGTVSSIYPSDRGVLTTSPLFGGARAIGCATQTRAALSRCVALLQSLPDPAPILSAAASTAEAVAATEGA